MAQTEHTRLNNEEIENKLRRLTSWTFTGQNIERTFVRKNFLDAVQFISQIAPLAESRDHHPDLLLSSYKNVKVMLSTHSAGGVTEKDFELAEAIDNIPS